MTKAAAATSNMVVEQCSNDTQGSSTTPSHSFIQVSHDQLLHWISVACQARWLIVVGLVTSANINQSRDLDTYCLPFHVRLIRRSLPRACDLNSRTKHAQYV